MDINRIDMIVIIGGMPMGMAMGAEMDSTTIDIKAMVVAMKIETMDISSRDITRIRGIYFDSMSYNLDFRGGYGDRDNGGGDFSNDRRPPQ